MPTPADYRLMTEATGQRIAAALEALSGTGAAAAAARQNLDVYSTSETDAAIQQSTAKEIISSLAVISGTPITIEKNNCYKYQSFAIVNIRVRVTGSISSGQIVLNGLPQMYGASLSSGSSAGAIASNKKRFAIDEYGQILTAESLSADDGMIVLSGMYAI